MEECHGSERDPGDTPHPHLEDFGAEVTQRVQVPRRVIQNRSQLINKINPTDPLSQLRRSGKLDIETDTHSSSPRNESA